MNCCMPYYQMMGYPTGSPIAGYPADSLESMYPEIYHRVYPKVRDICMMMDTPNNPEMYPNPSRAAVDRMTDDIYRRTIMETGDSEVDGSFDGRQFTPFGMPEFGGPPFGRRRPLRDLILILLLRELFRRRGKVF